LYDSQNRRIGIAKGPNESSLIWRKIIHQGNIPIGELDSTNGVSRWFVRGIGIAEGTGDVVAEIDDSGNPHYYFANHRGDTVVVLNNSGSEETYLQYDAFGNVVTNVGSFEPKYTFSTKEYLSDCQLYLYQRRVYDPISGRWTQRDPIDYQDSINLYQFCANNPVNLIDIDGQLIGRAQNAVFNPIKALFGKNYGTSTLTQDILKNNAIKAYKKLQGEHKSEMYFDTDFWTGFLNEEYWTYEGKTYRGNEVNYLGIGMYEAMLGNTKEEALTLVNKWKAFWYGEKANEAVLFWTRKGHDLYNEINNNPKRYGIKDKNINNDEIETPYRRGYRK